MSDRVLIQLTGADVLHFLQGLVTNDVLPLAKGSGIVWTALLTPQGKYLADFFVVHTAEGLLIDASAAQAPDLLKRLTMYRLRADVQMVPVPLPFARGLGDLPDGALADPRHPALGWRAYGQAAAGLSPTPVDWDALRVAHGVPEGGIELDPDSYILEMGFEPLHGVSFRKGCYVGQEVTARMKHKTETRRVLTQVTLSGTATPGTPVTLDGREVGRLGTVAGNRALALLRRDLPPGELRAGEAVLTA